jgi:DNA-binding CsgD family transcriptional regulator
MNTSDRKRVLNSPLHLPASVSQCTDRDLTILRLLGEGLDSLAIACRLRLQFQTVEAHRRNLQLLLNLNGQSLGQHRVAY